MNQSKIILNAAYECVSTKGYAETSLRQIAKEAGVTLSQLHYYYGSKQDLFKHVLIFMADKYMNEFDAAIEESGVKTKGITSMSSFFKDIIEFNPKLFSVVIDLGSLALTSETFKKIFTDLFDQLAVRINGVIKDSRIVNEELKDISNEKISRLLLGAFIGLGFQHALNPNKSGNILDSLEILNIVLE